MPNAGPVPAVATTILSVSMLAVFAFAAGSVYVIRRLGNRRQSLLMFAAAAVLLVNVLIWTLPG